MGRKKKQTGLRVSKNPNEYWENDKLFVKEIDKCKCLYKEGNSFHIECKLHQRGKQYFTFSEGNDFLASNNKKLYLTDKAKVIVLLGIQKFFDELNELKDMAIKIYVPELDMNIFYAERIENNQKQYDVIVETKLSSEKSKVEEFKGQTLRRMLEAPRFIDFITANDKDYEDKLTELFYSNESTIEQNPFYISALRRGDELLAKQIKLNFNVADDKDCGYLSQHLGYRILPKLPIEFDKIYVVNTHCIDYKLLERSGYRILHRPYFAMRNRTHTKITINPHTKIVVDAAPIHEPSMSFSYFLRLFGAKGELNVIEGRDFEKLNSEGQCLGWQNGRDIKCFLEKRTIHVIAIMDDSRLLICSEDGQSYALLSDWIETDRGVLTAKSAYSLYFYERHIVLDGKEKYLPKPTIRDFIHLYDSIVISGRIGMVTAMAKDCKKKDIKTIIRGLQMEQDRIGSGQQK